MKGENSSEGVLVICLQGIGNTLMTLYAVEKFLETHPARLYLAVSNNGSHELALLQAPKDQVYLWDESKSATNNILHLGIKLRQTNFNEVYLSYPSGRRESIIGLLTRATEKKVLMDGVGDWKFFRKLYKSKMTKQSKIHDINANFLLFEIPNQGFLSSGKVVIEAIRRDYDSYAEQFFSENSLLGNFVVALHPGAKGDGKRWAMEKFIQLCKELNKRVDCKFIIVGGDDELLLKKAVANGIGGSAVMLNSSSVIKTASVLRRCNLFIGNDSAPMHISAISGVPVIALWSYTDFYRTAPYGDGNVIVRKAYDCSPCYSFTDWYKDDCKYHLRCIKDLELDDVLPIVSHCIEIMLSEKRKVRTGDIHSLKTEGIDRIYALEHGCTVVDLKG